MKWKKSKVVSGTEKLSGKRILDDHVYSFHLANGKMLDGGDRAGQPEEVRTPAHPPESQDTTKDLSPKRQCSLPLKSRTHGGAQPWG